MFYFGHLLQNVQEHESDQGNRNLNADCILRPTDEMGDLQGLLQKPEEQLDLPAQLVKIGYLLRGCIEIVAEDAQVLAGFRHHDDLSHRNLHWIDAAIGLARRQKANPIAQDTGTWLN